MGRPVERLAVRYRRMSFDDSEEQLRRQADDVDSICELHDYRTKPEWLFTDDDESGNEDTRHRQGKGERPGLAALNEVVVELASQGHAVTVVAWVPSRLFRDAGHKEHYFRRWARLGDVQVHTKQGVWNPKDDQLMNAPVEGIQHRAWEAAGLRPVEVARQLAEVARSHDLDRSLGIEL